MNLCLAANAMGFATNWLTQWYSYNDTFKKALGLDERDNVAGFIYIGTVEHKPAERDRPDRAEITTFWEPGVKLNKGDNYGKPGYGLPRDGFNFPSKA